MNFSLQLVLVGMLAGTGQGLTFNVEPLTDVVCFWGETCSISFLLTDAEQQLAYLSSAAIPVGASYNMKICKLVTTGEPPVTVLKFCKKGNQRSTGYFTRYITPDRDTDPKWEQFGGRVGSWVAVLSDGTAAGAIQSAPVITTLEGEPTESVQPSSVP